MGRDSGQTNNRRRFLAALGTAAIGSLAGCSGDGPDGQTGDDGEDTGNAGENGQENRSNPGENGTPENGGSNETDPGNGQQNGGENGQENGTGNGGQNGQPDELLEAAKILDGEGQELDSIKLGEDNEEAVTSQNLTLQTEGNGEAEYDVSIEYEGEEPGFAEQLEQMLKNPETINLGEKINIGQLQYEQIKNQITENTNATININIQQGETSQEPNLDLEILAHMLDAEKMRQTNHENIQQAMEKVPFSPEGYDDFKFFDIKNLRRVAEHYGIEYQEEDELIDLVIQTLDGDTHNLDYTDMISVVGVDPEEEVVGFDDNARTWFFDEDIGEFTGTFNDGIDKSFPGDGDYISQAFGSFPGSRKDFYEDGDHPSILEGGDHPLFEFEEFENDIILKFRVGGRFNNGTAFERVPMENDTYNNVNVIKYNPEEDNFTEEIWFYREKQGGYEVLSTRVRDDVENLLHPITEVDMSEN